MGTTHIPGAEAARDLRDLLDLVRAGEDIVIDDRKFPLVGLELALQSFKDRGVEARKPRDISAWD